MCGINGIFAYHYAAGPIDASELESTREAMAVRGPDGKGSWSSEDGRIGLGHRRLAVIDLSERAAQPMASGCGRFVIAFNGEIYNHGQLRRSLEARGHAFRTRSDTEVLLQLYAAKGEDMLAELRGMFAIAIWDGEERMLLLARDTYGIKPLYYADDGWTCRFASQVKALTRGGGIRTDAEPAGLVGFYLFGSIPEPFTTLADVRCVPAGSAMRIDCRGAGRPRQYRTLAAVYREATSRPRKSGGCAAALKTALRESVAQHLTADVPIGCLLSGGVDSGALVGLMRDAGAIDIATVTVAFQDLQGRPEDETRRATEIAKLYGSTHTVRAFDQGEIEEELPRIFAAMDQPSIDGVNVWLAAKAACERGAKVMISGLGGDELLGGYSSFRQIPQLVRALRVAGSVPFAGRALRRLLAPVTAEMGLHPKAAGLLEFGGSYAGAYLLKRGLFMPWELDSLLDPDLAAIGLQRLAPMGCLNRALSPQLPTAFARVSVLEASFYMRNQLLRDMDWASMAHSLEVRVPFVDHVLLAEAARHSDLLAKGEGKAILASAPSIPLPHALLAQPKTGFTTPIALAPTRYLAGVASRGEEWRGGGRREPWARSWSRLVAAATMAV